MQISLTFVVVAASVVPSADEVGKPVALRVEPDTVQLMGPRSMQQLVVTGRYADGSERDLTTFACFRRKDAKVVAVQPNGLLRPRGNGVTDVIAEVAGQKYCVLVEVVDFARPQPVSFRREVMSALSISGCNSGSCHGIPSGRNGFRLSLWGHDPAFDYLSLTRDTLARRTNRQRPEESLILLKGLGQVQHEGGRRFGANSLAADILRTWLAEGLQDDPPSLSAAVALVVTPPSRVLRAPARFQQLAIQARFVDGSTHDVTRLTVYSSSDAAVGRVDANGLVEMRQSGEVAILCRFEDQVTTVRLAQLNVPPGFVWPNPPEHNYVDHHVFAKLRDHGIAPSELCTAAEFVRRVHLDVGGALPTAAEVRAFLTSTDANKRTKLIDVLLDRPEYADFWTLKWADLLRLNRKFIQPQGARAYHAWLRDAIARDAPLDQIVRALLTSTGHSYQNPGVNYYAVVKDSKNPEEALPFDICETTAQLFLGIRMKCAKCHNHPFERWTQDDYYGLAAFFTQIKQHREGRFGGVGNPEHRPVTITLDAKAPELVHPRSGKPVQPRVLRGEPLKLAPTKDRREWLAEWEDWRSIAIAKGLNGGDRQFR